MLFLFFRNIGLSLTYIDKLNEVQHAKEVLAAIRHQKFMKGKTAEEMESTLKHAIEQRNEKDINLTIALIESAGLTGLEGLIEEGHK